MKKQEWTISYKSGMHVCQKLAALKMRGWTLAKDYGVLLPLQCQQALTCMSSTHPTVQSSRTVNCIKNGLAGNSCPKIEISLAVYPIRGDPNRKALLVF